MGFVTKTVENIFLKMISFFLTCLQLWQRKFIKVYLLLQPILDTWFMICLIFAREKIQIVFEILDYFFESKKSSKTFQVIQNGIFIFQQRTVWTCDLRQVLFSMHVCGVCFWKTANQFRSQEYLRYLKPQEFLFFCFIVMSLHFKKETRNLNVLNLRPIFSNTSIIFNLLPSHILYMVLLN